MDLEHAQPVEGGPAPFLWESWSQNKYQTAAFEHYRYDVTRWARYLRLTLAKMRPRRTASGK